MSLSVSVGEVIERSKNPLLSISGKWKRVNLSDVCTVLNGFAFKSKYFNKEKKGLPLIRIRDVLKSTIETYYSGDFPKESIISKGDILVGMDGDFNCRKWNGIQGLLNQRVCKIELKTYNYHSMFLYLTLPAYLEEINNWTSAVTVKHLSSHSIKEIQLPLPPFNEQKRIAAKLNQIMPKIDGVKERLERIPQIIKRFRQSVLTAAATGKFTEKWREERPDADKWQQVKLGYLINNLTNGLAKRSGKTGIETIVLRLADIEDNKISHKKLRKIKLTEIERGKYDLNYNDILIIRVNGSAEIVGKAVCFTENEKWAFCDHLIRMKVKQEVLLQDYFIYYSQTFAARKYIDKYKVSSAGQNTISQETIRNMLIPLPSIEEQEEIVRQVDKLFAFADKLEDHYKKAKEKVAKFPPSVLAKAFRGELVPQDPDDESAEKLLERIQDEKAKMEAELKKTKKNVGGRKKAK